MDNAPQQQRIPSSVTFCDSICDLPNLPSHISNSQYRSIKCIYLNARSMVSPGRFEDIKTLIDSIGNIDLVFISESWLSNHSQAQYYQINNYTQYHAVREQSGGGAALYVRNDLASNIITCIEKFHSILKVEIQIQNVKITCMVIYNPNKDNSKYFLEDLETCLADKNHKNILLVGDFNIDILRNSKETDYLMELTTNFDLQLCNDHIPTRVTDHSSTLIDHLFAEGDFLNINSFIIDCDLSDHRLVVCEAKIKRSNSNAELNGGNLRKRTINYPLLNQYFHHNPFTLSSTSCDENFDNFVKYVNDGILLHSKERDINKKSPNSFTQPWINPPLLQLIHQKDIAYKKTKVRKPSNAVMQEYKEISNRVTKLKRELKKNYLNKKTSSRNPKDIWDAANQALNRPSKKQCTSIPKLQYQDKVSDNQEEICELFNNYYINVIEDLSKHLPTALGQPHLSHPVNRSMFLKPVTITELQQLLHSFPQKPNNAEISPYLLLNCQDSLIPPLLELINLSFQAGIFPNYCKTARVVPIFKGGDKTSPNNYRPISILNEISKVLEKLFKRRIVNFLNSINFFSSSQYGFTARRSTECAAFNAIKDIQTILDNGNISAGLLIDLRKAFDTVDHGLLLNKLESYGIRGPSYMWLSSYLSARQQYVQINAVKSPMVNIKIGVPQGSVMGPILFIIFINDISLLQLEGKLMLYADDILLLYEGTTEEEIMTKINMDLNRISEWLDINRLIMNVEKTKYLFFHSPRYCVSSANLVQIKSNTIERVDKAVYLGLNLDSTLSWKQHVDSVIKKISPVIGILSRLRHTGLDKQILLNIYYALIHSHFSYLIAIWGHCSIQLIKKLEVLQRRALKFIFGLHSRTPSILVYSQSQVLPVSKQADLSSIIYIHKIKNNLVSTNIKLTLNSNIHHHNTRNSSKLHQLHHKTTTHGTNSTFNVALKLYNSIPVENHNYHSPKKFKKSVTKFIQQQ